VEEAAQVDILENVDPKKVLEVIQEQCVLIVVRAHCWAGRHAIEDGEVHLEGKKLDDEIVGMPHWDLIPVEWRRRLGKFGPAARRAVRRAAIPFVVKGLYFVSLTKAEEVLKTVNDINDDYEQDVSEFVRAYDSIVEGIKKKLGNKYEQISKRLPAKIKLRSLFGIECLTMKIHLAEFNDRAAVGQFLRRTQNEMRKSVSQLVESLTTEPRRILMDSIGNLSRMLLDEKTIRQPSLDVVKRALDNYKSYAFVGDDTVLQAISKLENRLQLTTAKSLNSDGTAANALIEAMSKVTSATIDDVKEGRSLAKFKRSIAL